MYMYYAVSNPVEIPGPVLLIGRAFVHLSAIVWVAILVKQLMRCGKIHSE